MPERGLMTVEAPKLSNAVDRESYKLVYVDPEFDKLALFENGLTGSKLDVYLGFYNTLDYSIGTGTAVAPGQPLTNYRDLLMAYSGFVDTQGYTVDPSSGTIVAMIEGASPVASLGQIRSFMSTKDEMRHRNISDSAFDEIYVGAAKAGLLWGKK
jgi:hypothetical protein